MPRIVRTYLAAFRQSFTYNPRKNVYFWFGVLWGIPVPVVTMGLDYSLTGLGGRSLLEVIQEHPVHLFFLAHPLLFGLIFGAMGTVRHELELHNAELIQSLTDQATTDALTGLHNRRYVLEELHKALQRARRTEHPFCVVLFDLDGFKQINDAKGHAAGDVVLQKAATALNGIIREGDVLGRYGGDEFLLITYGDPVTAGALPERADLAVSRSTGLGTSAGIARFPEDGKSAEELVDRADVLLSEAKKKRYAAKGTTRRGFEPKKSTVNGD